MLEPYSKYAYNTHMDFFVNENDWFHPFSKMRKYRPFDKVESNHKAKQKKRTKQSKESRRKNRKK